MGDIYFIRHGETDWNEEDKLRGWSSIPLNADGRKESQQAGQVLKTKNILNYTAADLPRVVETAKIIARVTGKPYQLDSRLRDFDYGDWTGVPVQEVLPQLLKIFRAQEGTPPGGQEDYSDMEERTGQMFDGVLRHARHVNMGNFGLISSNRLARMFLAYIDGNNKWVLQKEDPLHNSGIVRFSLNDNLPGQGRGVGEGKDWGWEILGGTSTKAIDNNEE